jgi:hypothetical protein
VKLKRKNSWNNPRGLRSMALNAVFSISLNHTVGNGLNLSQKIGFNVESIKIGQSAIFNRWMFLL